MLCLFQGNGVSSPASLAMFEDQLHNLKVPVAFTTDRAFIPSFLEDWVFYQVRPKQVDQLIDQPHIKDFKPEEIYCLDQGTELLQLLLK